MILIETHDGRQLVHGLDGYGEENRDYMLVALDVPEPPSEHCEWDHAKQCWRECPVLRATAERKRRARMPREELVDWIDRLEARIAALEAR
jgi:hypothetical protein